MGKPLNFLSGFQFRAASRIEDARKRGWCAPPGMTDPPFDG